MRKNKLNWQVLARGWLDAPFALKPLWFKVLLPVLFLVSFAVAGVAFLRRLLLAQKTSALPFCPMGGNPVSSRRSEIQPNDLGGLQMPHIICVGNVLMGGSGKSPVVQQILRAAVEKERCVALVSRGYGREKKVASGSSGAGEPLVFNGDEVRRLLQAKQHAVLGDEAAENAQLLIWHLEENLGSEQAAERFRFFSVVLGAQRLNCVSKWLATLSKDQVGQAKLPCVAVLDDGLQNFSLMPDVSLCVWQKDLLRTAPPFTFPIGPYREGFGNVLCLRTNFNYNLWSRFEDTEGVDPSESIDKREGVDQRQGVYDTLSNSAVSQRARKAENFLQQNPSLRTFPGGHGRSGKNLFLHGRQFWLLPQKDPSWQQFVNLGQALSKREVSIVCGLGLPNAFLESTARSLSKRFLDSLASINDEVIANAMQNLCDPKFLLLLLAKQQMFLLGDHGLPSSDQLGILAQENSRQVFLMSAKDFFRLSGSPWLQNAIAGMRAFVVGIEVGMYDDNGSVFPMDLLFESALPR